MSTSRVISFLLSASLLFGCATGTPPEWHERSDEELMEVARFAVEEICLPSVLAGGTLAEWVDMTSGETSPKFLKAEVDSNDRNRGVLTKWSYMSEGQIDLEELPGDICRITARAVRSHELREKTITSLISRDDPFEFKERNKPKGNEPQNDFFCLTRDNESNILAIIQFAPKAPRSALQIMFADAGDVCDALG